MQAWQRNSGAIPSLLSIEHYTRNGVRRSASDTIHRRIKAPLRPGLLSNILLNRSRWTRQDSRALPTSMCIISNRSPNSV